MTASTKRFSFNFITLNTIICIWPPHSFFMNSFNINSPAYFVFTPSKTSYVLFSSKINFLFFMLFPFYFSFATLLTDLKYRNLICLSQLSKILLLIPTYRLICWSVSFFMVFDIFLRNWIYITKRYKRDFVYFLLKYSHFSIDLLASIMIAIVFAMIFLVFYSFTSFSAVSVNWFLSRTYFVFSHSKSRMIAKFLYCWSSDAFSMRV